MQIQYPCERPSTGGYTTPYDISRSTRRPSLMCVDEGPELRRPLSSAGDSEMSLSKRVKEQATVHSMMGAWTCSYCAGTWYRSLFRMSWPNSPCATAEFVEKWALHKRNASPSIDSRAGQSWSGNRRESRLRLGRKDNCGGWDQDQTRDTRPRMHAPSYPRRSANTRERVTGGHKVSRILVFKRDTSGNRKVEVEIRAQPAKM